MLVSFQNKNIQVRTQSLILITKSMMYRAFYYKIQISVTPDKNFISAQTFGWRLNLWNSRKYESSSFLECIVWKLDLMTSRENNLLESSPAQRLMGWCTNTLLPTTIKLLQPQGVDTTKTMHPSRQRQDKQRHYYNKKAKDLAPLVKGDVVQMQPFPLRRDGRRWS